MPPRGKLKGWTNASGAGRRTLVPLTGLVQDFLSFSAADWPLSRKDKTRRPFMTMRALSPDRTTWRKDLYAYKLCPRIVCVFLFVCFQLEFLRDSYYSVAPARHRSLLLLTEDDETRNADGDTLPQGFTPLPPRPLAPIAPVDCSKTAPQKPIQMGFMQAWSDNHRRIRFPVSFSWWERRLKSHQYEARKPVDSNDNVKLIYNLLKDEPGAFVDVGANVGFMANLGLALRRRVFAVEPIQYNVAKICEAYRSPFFELHRKFHMLELYQAVAGRSIKEKAVVVRPANDIGFYDQASLSRYNVQQPRVEEEQAPMLSLDSILFSNEDETTMARERIAMIKIGRPGT